MVFLSIVTLFIGVMYTWMGAFICFKGHYGLIANYIADEKAGRFDAAYARRVGWIWLVSGVACLLAGVAGLMFDGGWLMIALMLACIIGSLVAYRVNYRRSIRSGV